MFTNKLLPENLKIKQNIAYLSQNIAYFWPLTFRFDLYMGSRYILIFGWTSSYTCKHLCQEILNSYY